MTAEQVQLDGLDKRILNARHENPDIGVREMAREFSCDPATISRRLKRLAEIELDAEGEPIQPEPPKPREPRPSDLYEILKPYGPPDEFARRGLFVGQRVTRGLLHQCRLPASAMVAQRCLRPIDAPERAPLSFQQYANAALDRFPTSSDRAEAVIGILRGKIDAQRLGTDGAPENPTAFIDPLLAGITAADVRPGIAVDSLLRGPQRVRSLALDWFIASDPDDDQIEAVLAAHADMPEDRDFAEQVRRECLTKLASRPMSPTVFIALHDVMKSDRSRAIKVQAAELLLRHKSGA